MQLYDGDLPAKSVDLFEVSDTGVSSGGFLAPNNGKLSIKQTSVSRAQRNVLRRYFPGLPDFSWCMIPKPKKTYQMNTICTELS
jgi:hypothetical protein